MSPFLTMFSTAIYLLVNQNAALSGNGLIEIGYKSRVEMAARVCTCLFHKPHPLFGVNAMVAVIAVM